MQSKVDLSNSENIALFNRSSNGFKEDSSVFDLEKFTNLTNLYSSVSRDVKFIMINDNEVIKQLVNHIPTGCEVNDTQTIPIHLKKSLDIKSNNNLSNGKVKFVSKCKSAEKIILRGFPLGQYILNFNGGQYKTAQYENGYYVFDLSKKEGKNIVDMTRENNKFLNLTQFDNIHIRCNSQLEQKDFNDYKIFVLGNYEIMTKTMYGYVEEYLYKTLNDLCINHTTYQLLLKNNSKYKGTIKFNIDGVESDKILFDGEYLLVRFENNSSVYFGAQNDYLDDYLNKHTLNFGRVGHAHIIFDDNFKSGSIDMTQTYYMPHKFCEPMFSSY